MVQPLGTLPSFQDLNQSQYYRSYNALITQTEFGLSPTSSLNLINTYTNLQPDRPFDGLLAHLHTDQWDILAGSQFLVRATPFSDQYLMYGLRAGGRVDDWSAGAFVGELQSPFEELRGVRRRRKAAGASLSYTPNDFQSYGLAFLDYASLPEEAVHRNVWMGQLYQGGETENSSYGIALGLGLDTSADLGKNPYGFRLQAGYRSPSLDISINSRSLGVGFGPATALADFRGTQFSTAQLNYRFTPELWFSEQVFVNETGLGSSTPSHVSSRTHSLNYRDRELALSLGLQQLDLQAGSRQSQAESWYFRGSTQLDKIGLSCQFRSTHQTGQDHSELGLGLTVPITPELDLRVQEFMSQSSTGRSLSSNASAFLRLGQWGALNVGYLRQDTLDLGYLQGYSRDNLVVGGNLNLLGNLRLYGSAGAGAGLAALRYVPDEHNELTLEHRFQSRDLLFYYNDLSTLPLSQVTAVTWNSSWGGPGEQRLRSELQGACTVKVMAHAPGQEELFPVSAAAVKLDESSGLTNKQGEAAFRPLNAGKHRLLLLKDQLPPELELDDPPEAQVEVGVGSTEEATFRATAYSSLEVILFNDPEGKGRLNGADYQPLARGEVQVGQSGRLRVPADGRLMLERLQPGTCPVALIPSSLEPGMEPTTPVSTTVDLKPGLSTRVLFAAQGYGTLRVKARQLRAGAMTVASVEPCPRTAFKLRSGPLGKTDEAGCLESRVPAGRLQLFPVAADQYVVEGATETVVNVNRASELSLTLARLGRIKVELIGDQIQPGMAVSLKSTGMPDQVNYLGPEGVQQFQRLRLGEYRCVLEADTLPQGLVCTNPVQVVRLGSGQSLIVRFNIKRSQRKSP